jgi:homoserine kinase
VANGARAALLVVALTQRPGLLADALEDRLHQPYRLPSMPGTKALFEELRAEGIPACLAGSGPSLLAFETAGHPVPDPGGGWLVLRPSITGRGATLAQG